MAFQMWIKYNPLIDRITHSQTVIKFTAGIQVGPDERIEIVRICSRGGMGVVGSLYYNCYINQEYYAAK